MLRDSAKVLGTILCLGAIAFAAMQPGIWLDVPFVQQERDGCGSASIAMVMQYWSQQQGRPAGPNSAALEIQRVLYSRQAHGIYASQMQQYFEEQGFQTFAFRGDWNDLKQHLGKGRPLIVALKPGARDVPLHYVVIAGLDWDQNLVLVNDPAQRKLLKQDRSSFEREWSAANQWTLLALPQAQTH
jgi:ABC-type bacteriocin/lantibiotic exporter with double-glycine peptidase domain